MKLKKRSLFNTIINHCHQQYTQIECNNCNHPFSCNGLTRGNCKQCLEEVHYPGKYPQGRKDYECDKMMNFYVCDYTVKYASEILYLMRKSKALEQIKDYHVLSIGCGACPDLMALERYCHETSYDKTICYLGIDINERWKHIHKQINAYRTSTIKNTQFKYFDAVTNSFSISDANVLILQYVISHFYNTGQIAQIDIFFKKLVNAIINHKQENIPMAILINDVNSVNRGRDFFYNFVEQLNNADLHSSYTRFYFDYNIKHSAQRYGERHESNQVLFQFPDSFNDIYQPWMDCSSAQLLIEVQ